MRQHLPPRSVSRALIPLAVGLLLLATGVARADTQYQIQPIVKYGDTVAGINIEVEKGAFLVIGMTDTGHLAFTTWVAGLRNGTALIEYADGIFTPIAVANTHGPTEKWPENLVFYAPESMNQLGDIVFAAKTPIVDGGLDLGTYRWDAKARAVVPIALQEMPAGNDLTFVTAGWWSPSLNNRGEVAFPAVVRNETTGVEGVGAFLASPNGGFVPLVVPGQMLPDGRKVSSIERPYLNDAGAVVFLAYREGDADDGRNSAYRWEKGTITPLVMARSDAPGGGKIARIHRAWANDKNRNVLIMARLNNAESGAAGLYLLSEGKLTPVVVRGQEMPGGGQFRDMLSNGFGVSPPNSLGQHAFTSTLADGSTAAYLMDADGKLSLIMKSGAPTEFGKISGIGVAGSRPGTSLIAGSWGLALNSKGHVALPVQIDGGLHAIILLTPVTP